MSPIRSLKAKSTRQSLRLDSELWDLLDAFQSGRPGNVSLNTWIAEAVTEQLAAEQDNQAAAWIEARHV